MSIEVKGLDKILKKIEKLKNLDKSTLPLMQTLGNTLRNEIELSFENEKSPFGGKWKPLKEPTLKAKIKKGESEKILRKSGNLSDNWSIDATPTKVSISNNSQGKNGFKYGLTHQFGSAKKGIPAREFLPIDKNHHLPNGLKNQIIKDVESFIEKKLKD